MKVEFTIPFHPFSINAMHYRDQRIKTTEARQWSDNITHFLSTPSIQPKLKLIKDNFNIKTNGITAELIFLYPKEILLTKKGVISSRCFDITNVEKPLIDLIFLQQNGLDVDDKYLLSCNSFKKLSPDDSHYIKIKLEVVEVAEYLQYED